ncbi:uncharacterized protein LOC123656176 [Melitaea cinxia]|uniref:uncharacterized protein LOC123656176 n=1 Tax=Melitaea cinxia TaxID=113334 RepID=UPI001E2736E6|nr:uncharacterized protein LOC123656176 [Melitaea cinxia]
MGFLIENTNFSIRLSLTVLRLAGFWSPDGLKHRFLYNCYGFGIFMFFLGTYLIIQIVDLYLIWGNLPLMTGTAFVLFTNMAHATKIMNILVRRNRIQKIINDADNVLKGVKSAEGMEIVRSCDRETKLQQLMFFFITLITTIGWASSAEKNELPLRAWYPYDTRKSPAYQLTYCHQILALFLAASLNISKDTLVTAMIAQCRCRLRLVGLDLRNLCNDDHIIGETSLDISLKPSPKTLVLTPDQEERVRIRLRECAAQHQRTLEAAVDLQNCFSEPTFGQFAVSLVIICVTAFQLVSQTSNLVRLISMGTYLLNMMFQVFIYCYQGHHLSTESEEVAVAAYNFPWYSCSVLVRRSIIIMMERCRRTAKITAGGFTTLSLASFMAIIKTSYSMFTLLQRVNERNYMRHLTNVNLSLRITLIVLMVAGVWGPNYKGFKKRLYNVYTFISIMIIVGVYIVIQFVDLVLVWGKLNLMTATLFLLFTNVSLLTKIVNAICKKEIIRIVLQEAHDELSNEQREVGKEIVKSCDVETTKQLMLYTALSYITILAFASSTEKNQLPLRAWYPYDTSKTPAYQLTYAHQSIALSCAAAINICLDTLVTSLISQCRCRLRLISLSLRTLCDDLEISYKGMMTDASSRTVNQRLRNCVLHHQAVLAQTKVLQSCFKIPIFIQFSVSMIIICVTAYQLAVDTSNFGRIIAVVVYLLVMMLQVFFYCYHGSELVDESEGVSRAAYECPWYTFSVPTRRSLLMIMTRTRLVARLTAAGIMELSLSLFMSLIKASYSFFTVLQQVEES